MVCHLVSMVCRKFISRVILFDLLFLSSILQPICYQSIWPRSWNLTDFTVKNSLDFCDQIKHVKLEEDDELVSFDVVSLFTSIPVELAIQVATDVLSKEDT